MFGDCVFKQKTAYEMRISDWSSDVCSSDLFTTTPRGHGAAFVIEMTTTPGCVPCGDLWTKLTALGTRYGWQVRTIGSQEAMIRSGRLGLPWVGHPVAWVRPIADDMRFVPVAIGTDHARNLARERKSR